MRCPRCCRDEVLHIGVGDNGQRLRNLLPWRERSNKVTVDLRQIAPLNLDLGMNNIEQYKGWEWSIEEQSSNNKDGRLISWTPKYHLWYEIIILKTRYQIKYISDCNIYHENVKFMYAEVVKFEKQKKSVWLESLPWKYEMHVQCVRSVQNCQLLKKLTHNCLSFTEKRIQSSELDQKKKAQVWVDLSKKISIRS